MLNATIFSRLNQSLHLLRRPWSARGFPPSEGESLTCKLLAPMASKSEKVSGVTLDVPPCVWKHPWPRRGTESATSSEAMWYRLYFEKYFNIPGAALLVPYGKTCACSSDTAAGWEGNEIDDASGRSVKKHIKSVLQ